MDQAHLPTFFTSTNNHTPTKFIVILLCSWIVYSIRGVLRRRYGSIQVTYPSIPGVLDNGENCQQLVERSVGSLKDGFRASWWLPNGHAQTIYSALANFSADDHVSYERKLLQLPDGGTIGIDLFPPLSISLSSSAPVVMVNHGLTGGSHESYVRNMVLWLTKPWDQGGLGGRAAVVNFRGCASTPLTSPHLYSTGSTIDLHTATVYMTTLFPEAPLLGVGFSTGAAVMTRYLGEQGHRCRLGGAVVLCCPLELRRMTSRLDSQHFFPRLYSLSMAHKILHSLTPHLLPTSPLLSPSSHLHVHVPEIFSLTASLRRRTARQAANAPCVIWFNDRPTLGISALDDPIVSGVPQGGHLGWFDGPYTGPGEVRHRRWHVKPTLEFLRAIVADLPSSAQAHARTRKLRKVGDWCFAGEGINTQGWYGKAEVGWKVVT
ncbi:hypothetical protein I316_05368 [Kwoniella heveanensis BCC8398]|uniref:Anon-23da protein n=1 Tax=Kwoniella heveanensis BCC8398 TaxID=1296120 RepID=A0A1B9GPN1_9TREE|nr:hypothetical protein I316_05368 [Kwoniella heveanensis BCC8398]